ncbi:hypothetical protein OU415_27110 [Saccharopolyspora sp. WRP15-2]|uniref:Uncharacterized protein n=1 Tax=Saccharopolyspora oryzae TaxID=2997343 RepID=A0ABT4V589_9PSEU|nr:hypothetical protein [Saccharopolyspora oryzae]MDA3629128.1 hypothetical protein [Saccharopolyspora oryzae]
MRKINRVLAAGALTLPLALGIAGVASAEGQDTNIRVESQASAQVHGRGSVNASSQASAQVHGRGTAEANSHASVLVAGRESHWNHRDGLRGHKWNDIRWSFHQVRGHHHEDQDELCFLDHGLIGHNPHTVR